jgi:hypothetical protein
MVASLDDVSKLIEDKWIGKLAKSLISEYNIITKEWVTMPNIFFDTFSKHATLDPARNAVIFKKIEEWFNKKWDFDTMNNAINNDIDRVFISETSEIIDELKWLYAIYPRLIENPVTRNLVIWERIEWLEKIVNNDIESIKSFKTYQHELQEYAPNVEIDMQNVYDMWYWDTIKANWFIPKFITTDKMSIKYNQQIDMLLSGSYKQANTNNLDQYKCN